MKPFERLANAIVLKAVDDYRAADSPAEREDIERFFLSGWFTALTNADGGYILNKLREERVV